jgi:molybdopterin molybdotransferase
MPSVEEALELVRAAVGVRRAAVERVPLEAALGRVLAEDVAMDHDVPPFRRATMDGFAVTDDGRPGTRYAVVGRVRAGESTARPVGAGEAVRVMTGAPVPPGTARVLPFEWTREKDEREMEVERRPGADPNVVEPGAHVRAGSVVLRAGTRIGPGTVGVLATAGRAEVPVARRPRVAVLGTGDELVAVGARPGPAQIRNSNGPTLAAQVRRAGGEPADLGWVGDEDAALRSALERGLAHDLFLVSGGASHGDFDLVPGALARLGVTETFHGWDVQPGGPLWFGRRGAVTVIALPGNPAASFVGFEVLGVPVVATLLGRPFAPRATLRARWEGADPGGHARRRFRPVTLGADEAGALVAKAVAWKGSGDPFALAAAHGLAVIEERGLLPEGRVDVIPLDVLPGGAPA